MKTKVFWFALPLIIFAMISYTAFGKTVPIKGTPATIIAAGNLGGDGKDDLIGGWSDGGFFYYQCYLSNHFGKHDPYGDFCRTDFHICNADESQRRSGSYPAVYSHWDLFRWNQLGYNLPSHLEI